MDTLELTSIGPVIKSMMNDEFAVVGAVTFFLCEAIFNMFPIERAKMKQLTALIVGAVLGFFLMEGKPLDGMIQGLLAGGAATIVVAKFKKPKTESVAVAPTPSVTTAPLQQLTATVTSAPLEPIEHL